MYANWFYFEFKKLGFFFVCLQFIKKWVIKRLEPHTTILERLHFLNKL
jgi:hypothetical protein